MLGCSVFIVHVFLFQKKRKKVFGKGFLDKINDLRRDLKFDFSKNSKIKSV